jgi:hypothetical protein
MSGVTDVDGNVIRIRPNRERRRAAANDLRRAMSRQASSRARKADRQAAKAKAIARKAARTKAASS